MTKIVDVSTQCGHKAGALRAAGVETVIRYYSRDTTRPAKRLTVAEAVQLAAAGLRIAIVHEGRRGDQTDNFDRRCGIADAQYAFDYGAHVIGQPGGSAIYFGVDVDVTDAQIRTNIIPYFQGIADCIAALPKAPDFTVGVYGSGRTCRALLDAGLARLAWLAQSTGWAEYKMFLASNRWALSQGPSSTLAGVDCDPNQANESGKIGDFVFAAAPAVLGAPAASAASGALPAAAPAPVPRSVNARHGLRVRAGPGTNFEIIPPSLTFGTAVFPLRVQDGWTLIDRQGDGKADGFVSSGFLVDMPVAGGTAPSPVLADPVMAPLITGNPDAADIPELIRQGTNADELKRARTTAKAALPGYPTNGCAAHLSALLQQAGIAVPMTFGAGMLAHVLGERNWKRIACGSQKPGDVGVCFDNNPNPPGADHIYLVVSTDGPGGPDRMMIADNQREADAPHERFASGHGRTPTEYFLRAV